MTASTSNTRFRTTSATAVAAPPTTPAEMFEARALDEAPSKMTMQATRATRNPTQRIHNVLLRRRAAPYASVGHARIEPLSSGANTQSHDPTINGALGAR